jgi:hypothetical protein
VASRLLRKFGGELCLRFFPIFLNVDSLLLISSEDNVVYQHVVCAWRKAREAESLTVDQNPEESSTHEGEVVRQFRRNYTGKKGIRLKVRTRVVRSDCTADKSTTREEYVHSFGKTAL